MALSSSTDKSSLSKPHSSLNLLSKALSSNVILSKNSFLSSYSSNIKRNIIIANISPYLLSCVKAFMYDCLLWNPNNCMPISLSDFEQTRFTNGRRCFIKTPSLSCKFNFSLGRFMYLYNYLVLTVEIRSG